MALAALSAGVAAEAHAQAYGDLVDMTVVDRETGQVLRTWRHDGRLFVAGQPGARYALRITNRSDGRVLVVMSVDGVNILTGETAGYGQRGYVFSPHQAYDIGGWRKSDTEIAAFTFAPLPQSYAARTGRPGEVGVIGIAAFKERVVPPPVTAVTPAYEPRPQARNDSLSEIVVTGQRVAPAPPAPAARAAAGSTLAQPAPFDTAERRIEKQAEKLGTAHGAREWSVTTSVPFERASPFPQLVRRIEYDTYDNLVTGGVIPRPRDPPHRPRPFPGSDGAGYVPDPPPMPGAGRP
jgi:hypothetical protein